MIRCIGFLSLVLWLVAGHAEDIGVAMEKEPDNGWFWYKDPKLAEKEKKEEKKQVIPASPGQPSEPAPMSAEWISAQMPKSLRAAIDKPTEDNMRALILLQRVWLDKSTVFSEEWKKTIKNNPYLDENNRIPVTGAMKTAKLRGLDDAKKKLLDDLSNKIGLLIFLDKNCEWCYKQVSAVNASGLSHKFETRLITKDDNPVTGLPETIKWREGREVLSKIKIRVWPAVAIIAPPNDIYLISEGAMAGDSISDQILMVANEVGLISEQQYADITPYTNNMLVDGENKEQVDWNDQKSWSGYLNDQLNDIYENEK